MSGSRSADTKAAIVENRQRIEQRIGRCHRYGRQHDVVLVNFLNRRNAADRRVFQLLSQKFRLFDGVFRQWHMEK